MLLRVILVLVCSVGVHTVVAQDTTAKPPKAVPEPNQQPQPKTAQPGGRITGTVLCSDTGKPARGAEISLSRAQTPGQHDGFRKSAVTDTDGRFLFEHLKPGIYLIRTHSNGYLFTGRSDSPNASSLDVPLEKKLLADETVTIHSTETVKYDVTLERAATLSGHVFFDDGSPAMGADIRVEKIDPKLSDKPLHGAPSYERIIRIGDRGQTDDRGFFRITTLNTGTYRIAAIPRLKERESYFDFDDELTSDDEGEIEHPDALAVFSGDTIHRAQAKTYKLRPGDDISDIFITIPLKGLYKIEGSAVAGDGRVLNSGMVTLIDKSDFEIHFRTNLQNDGSFLFTAIPSGTYKFTLSHGFIEKPDIRNIDYSDDDAVIPTNAFGSIESTVIVKDSDVLDLHFEVQEVPMPPKKPEDNK